MFEDYALYICLTAFVLLTIYRTAEVVAANLFDITDIKMEKKRTTLRGKRPLISVVVYARNDEQYIQNCITGIIRSTARKLEIIVIDDTSSDQTVARVQHAIVSYPKQTITLIEKQKHISVRCAYADALSHIRGDIIVLLKAGDVLDRSALKVIADRMGAPDGPVVAWMNVHAQLFPSFMALLEEFDYAQINQEMKARAQLRRTYAELLAPGTAYTYDSFYKLITLLGYSRLQGHATEHYSRQNVQMKGSRFGYIHTAVVRREPSLLIKNVFKYQEHVSHFIPIFNSGQTNRYYLSAVASNIQAILRIGEPVVITYFMYLAWPGRTSMLLFLSWSLYVIWQALAIWSSEHIGALTKAGLTLLAPSMFVLMYIRAAVFLVVLVSTRMYEACRRLLISPLLRRHILRRYRDANIGVELRR